MDFTIPTTKTAMYEVLNELFIYYRLRRTVYEAVTPTALSLPRLSFTAKTDAELNIEAQTSLSEKHAREILARQNDFDVKIAALNVEKQNVIDAAAVSVTEITAKYDSSIADARADALSRGMEASTIVVSKIADLEAEKVAKIAVINADKNAKCTKIDADITSYTTQKQNAATYFSNVHSDEIDALTLTLKEKQKEEQTEVIKYNNSLLEKETKYSNTLLQSAANLELKYAELSSTEISKDDLITLGYYADVMDCVCGYYYTLSATAAYNDIKNEAKLIMYLEDYYENFILLFKTRAS